MAFWTVKTDSESVRDVDGGGNYIINSGMYEVQIRHVIVRRNEKGGMHLDMIVFYSGMEQTIYRAFGILNNDGTANFGSQLFNRLCVVCGGSNGFVIGDPVRRNICVNQREGKYEECDVLEEFDDKNVILRMQRVYRRWEGKIRSSTEVRNVFRMVDHASASEIASGSQERGKQYAKELPESTKTVYRDGITEEEAKQADEERRQNKSQNAFTRTFEPQKKRRFSDMDFSPSEGSENKGYIDEVPF